MAKSKRLSEAQTKRLHAHRCKERELGAKTKKNLGRWMKSEAAGGELGEKETNNRLISIETLADAVLAR